MEVLWWSSPDKRTKLIQNFLCDWSVLRIHRQQMRPQGIKLRYSIFVNKNW